MDSKGIMGVNHSQAKTLCPFMFYFLQKLKLANKYSEFERFFVTLPQIGDCR